MRQDTENQAVSGAGSVSCGTDILASAVLEDNERLVDAVTIFAAAAAASVICMRWLLRRNDF